MGEEQQPRPHTVPLPDEDDELLRRMGITLKQLEASGRSLEHIKQFGLDGEW